KPRAADARRAPQSGGERAPDRRGQSRVEPERSDERRAQTVVRAELEPALALPNEAEPTLRDPRARQLERQPLGGERRAIVLDAWQRAPLVVVAPRRVAEKALHASLVRRCSPRVAGDPDDVKRPSRRARGE